MGQKNDAYRNLHALALAEARQNIGRGEELKNNEGPYVRELMNLFAHRTAGPWCAAFVCNMFDAAAKRAKMQRPFQYSASARRLAERFEKIGRKVEGKPNEGDIVVWWRGHRTRSRKGHVGFVEYVHPRGDWFLTIEGNQGRYPATVDVFAYRYDHKRLLGFYRLY